MIHVERRERGSDFCLKVKIDLGPGELCTALKVGQGLRRMWRVEELDHDLRHGLAVWINDMDDQFLGLMLLCTLLRRRRHRHGKEECDGQGEARNSLAMIAHG